MKERVEKVKKSTVRIFVDGQPNGSGFVISEDGLIATCFHVVQKVEPLPNGQTNLTFSQSIEVELNEGNKLPAVVHNLCLNHGFLEALSKDYCILKINMNNLTPLKLGTFDDVDEGAAIYLSGFPFGISQSVVATGILSTKWTTTGYLGQGSSRQVAWLDIIMNKGNSGGPIIVMGPEPKDDEIIGIATFGLNPFAEPAEEFMQIAHNFPGNAELIGVDFKKFSTLIGTALASNSLGVSGCVSIDYLKSRMLTDNDQQLGR